MGIDIKNETMDFLVLGIQFACYIAVYAFTFSTSSNVVFSSNLEGFGKVKQKMLCFYHLDYKMPNTLIRKKKSIVDIAHITMSKILVYITYGTVSWCQHFM